MRDQFKRWTRRRLIAICALASGLLTLERSTLTRSANATSTSGKSPAKGAIKVAVVLGKHNTLIDFAGPWEVLSSAGYFSPGFDVYSVATSKAPVLCDDGRGVAGMAAGKPLSGLTVIPDFTFASVPRPEVVLMGAQIDDDEEEKVAWIRRAASQAALAASVCTGAFLLAKTGLLDGKQATTNRNAYDAFAKAFPNIRLVRAVRFVDNGTTATAAGLTAGVDLALHVVRRFYGGNVAEKVADYEEWPSRGWNRV
jgi:transcriptional regulator GlxA family with amidase domain